MYKKIKNGSFMNLIWFIIAILPLCFILFSLNNEDNKTKIYNNLTSVYGSNEVIDYLDIDSDLFVAVDEYNFDYNNYIYEFNTIKNEKEDGYFYKFNFAILPKLNKNLYFYFKMQLYSGDEDNLEQITDLNRYQLKINNGISNVLLNVPDEQKDYYLYKFSESMADYVDTDYFMTFSIRVINQFDNLSRIKLYFYTLDEDIDINYFIDEPNQIIIQPLNYWFNKFTSNGFISSAFLNLAQLFGVNNIYYSLACYYIEYLLVIVLLHLVFDVLYMLPNICHKFMEKIGGERD